MIQTEFLDVYGNQIPVQKIYDFEDLQLIFKIHENSEGFFTIQVYDINDENFLYSNKVVYGQEIFDTILAPSQQQIIPLNLTVESGQGGNIDITVESLGKEIKLYTNIEDKG